MVNNHACHAVDCDTPCKPEYLMCFHHWRMVPQRLAKAVYATYRHGQCDDKAPSREWMVAANAAIRHVAERDGISPGRYDLFPEETALTTAQIDFI
jgi:hypothetical protein